MQQYFNKLYIALGGILIIGVVIVLQQPARQSSEFNKQLAAEDIQPFAGYVRGVVVSVDDEVIREFDGNSSLYQMLTLNLSGGQDARQTVQVEQTTTLDNAQSSRYRVGDKLVLGLIDTEQMKNYVIVDRYRLPAVMLISGLFMLLAILLGRWRGVSSLIGLGATGLVLIYFIAPQILSGKDPFLVSLVGAGLIVLTTMFVAHGIKLRIQIAALSTLITLTIAAVMAYLAVKSAGLFGLGQADAFVLGVGYFGNLDLKGVLLGGIIISVLGVLDDITTSQTAAIEELHKADPTMSAKQLYSAGLSIGREHIASLINTLILVYAGASLPLFLLLTAATNQPVWVLINSEYMAEEIIRAVIGSAALIAAVPISSYFAAWYYTKFKVFEKTNENQ